MELREFAERVLFGTSLGSKLCRPPRITDEQPGPAIAVPEMPGRPNELHFKPAGGGKSSLPGVGQLEKAAERGRLLHFFANHELLATELMALVLLRFPKAPAAFRRGVLQTLQQEQEHTAWYLRRMKECGVAFGEQPVSGYFWRAISRMETPLDYVAGLSLTFEQANLDFSRSFSECFARIGDTETAGLLERIYRDEIGHVAYGLKWFRRWKDPRQNDWEAFCRQLKYPMSAQRAKGPSFNVAGRLAAGFDREFIDRLNVYSQSKGRTPSVFVFNPFAEGYLAQGESFTPRKHQQLLQEDLQNLPQFLCRQDDVVLVRRRSSASFLSGLKGLGWAIPEFVEMTDGKLDQAGSLRTRKLAGLRPWAWGPDSVALLTPLLDQVTEKREPATQFNEAVASLYSKQRSADLLRRMLAQWADAGFAGAAQEVGAAWLCTEAEVGKVAFSLAEVRQHIASIRAGGQHNLVVKEAIGLAGHNAIRLLEPELLESQRRWIERTLAKGQPVVIEPWLERELDFSVQFEMGPDRLKRVGYTGLWTDRKGQFQGNWAWPGFQHRLGLGLERLFPHLPDIGNRVCRLYNEVAAALEQELRVARFRGPLGLDALVYRVPGGGCRIKPIVEINPRYTMGRLTLELMSNVGPGRFGAFRLIGHRQLQSDGFADFASWARAASQRNPPRLAGEPIPKLWEGMVCLNEPGRAQVCLATFTVTAGAPVFAERAAVASPAGAPGAQAAGGAS